MRIRNAKMEEARDVLDFYHDVIEGMKKTDYPVKWQPGVYPILEDMENAIREDGLYVLESDEILGAFILTRRQGEGYDRAEWSVEAEPQTIRVMHLLATRPDHQQCGFGKMMLQEAAVICREQGDRVIRLDTLPWNVPGKRLYEHFGFRNCGDVTLEYPTTGKIAFTMYEYEL